MNSALIDAYEHSVQKVRAAVAGLAPEKMKAFPIPGTWSIHQIVIHVVDSDLVGADRMKRIIAMDNPPLSSYDETLFTQRLAYHEQSIDDALETMRLNSRQMGRVLKALPESALARKGIHSQEGELTLKQMLERMIKHVDHHLKFIVDKRKLV
jgi:uncharacterized damage-inducible protein DinB